MTKSNDDASSFSFLWRLYNWGKMRCTEETTTLVTPSWSAASGAASLPPVPVKKYVTDCVKAKANTKLSPRHSAPVHSWWGHRSSVLPSDSSSSASRLMRQLALDLTPAITSLRCVFWFLQEFLCKDDYLYSRITITWRINKCNGSTEYQKWRLVIQFSLTSVILFCTFSDLGLHSDAFKKNRHVPKSRLHL